MFFNNPYMEKYEIILIKHIKSITSLRNQAIYNPHEYENMIVGHGEMMSIKLSLKEKVSVLEYVRVRDHEKEKLTCQAKPRECLSFFITSSLEFGTRTMYV